MTFLNINGLRTNENEQRRTYNLLNPNLKKVSKEKVMDYLDVDEEKKLHQLSGRIGEKKFDLKFWFLRNRLISYLLFLEICFCCFIHFFIIINMVVAGFNPDVRGYERLNQIVKLEAIKFGNSHYKRKGN